MLVLTEWLIGDSIGKTELQCWIGNYNGKTFFSYFITRFAPVLYGKTLQSIIALLI